MSVVVDESHVDPVGAALFGIDGDTVTATEYARGPWDPRACHGGPVAALLLRAVEGLQAGEHDRAADAVAWQIARTTIELVRPVPVLVPMTVSAEVERPGRNVGLVASALRTVDGVEVARARTLRIRAIPMPLDVHDEPHAPLGEPGTGRRVVLSWAASDGIAYHRDAIELRFVAGHFDEPGPAQLWCRLRVPVVPGEEPSGAQRVVAAADFGNGVSAELDPQVVTFINPDLTVHFARRPEGEWVGLDARSHYGPMGAGFAESAVFDQAGRVGRAAQSLLVSLR